MKDFLFSGGVALLLSIAYAPPLAWGQVRSYYNDRVRRPNNPPMPPLWPERERPMPPAPRPIGPALPVEDFRRLMVAREQRRADELRGSFADRMANLREIMDGAERGAIQAAQDFHSIARVIQALGLLASDGLVAEKDIPTAEMQKFRREVQLQTIPYTEEGLAVRDIINRGLAGMRPDSTPMQNSEIWGAISLALGADQAYADGKKDVGDFLSESGLTAVDLTLSLTPVVGGLNDLLQIAIGLMTGDDYTGQPMGTADYAMRGIGVVLSVMPGGKPAVRLGTEYLDRAWISGGALLNKTGLGAEVGRLIFRQRLGRDESLRAAEVAAAAARMNLTTKPELAAFFQAVSFTQPRWSLRDSSRIVQAWEHAPAPKFSGRWVRDLNQAGTLSTDFAQSFANGIEHRVLRPGEILYQVRGSNDAPEWVGRFFSKQIAATPEHADSLFHVWTFGNDARRLKMFRVREEVSVFFGRVRDGGGNQFVVPEDVQVLDVMDELAEWYYRP